MSDTAVTETLANHARQLGALSTEVSGIRTSLAAQDHKLDRISEAIVETRAARGPTFKEVLSYGIAVVTLVGACALGIRMLVSADMAPDLRELRLDVGGLKGAAADRERADRDELRLYREREQRRIDTRLGIVEGDTWRRSVETSTAKGR